MPKWRCPNGHENDNGIVCGGDGPHYRHWAGPEPIEPSTAPNVYFLMNLTTGQYVREVVSDLPFTLEDEDWQEMEDHCAGGCCSEPQCVTCQEFLVRGDTNFSLSDDGMAALAEENEMLAREYEEPHEGDGYGEHAP